MKINLYIPLPNVTIENDQEIQFHDSKIFHWKDEEKPISSFRMIKEISRKDNPIKMGIIYENIDTNKEEDWGQTLREMFDKSIIILKLFKNSLVHTMGYIYPIGNEREGRPVPIGYSLMPHYVTYNPERLSDTYVIKENDIDPLTQFWKEMKDINPRSFPLRQFNIADYNPYSISKTIDYVSGIESLISVSSNTEISFQFRTIGSIIIGRNHPDHIKQIYDNLKNLYTIRSNYIHGNPDENKSIFRKVKPEVYSLIARNYLKELLLFFIWNDLLSTNRKRRKDFIENMIIYENQINEKFDYTYTLSEMPEIV